MNKSRSKSNNSSLKFRQRWHMAPNENVKKKNITEEERFFDLYAKQLDFRWHIIVHILMTKDFFFFFVVVLNAIEFWRQK